MDPPPKLRVMCSYGGHIVPRPRTKSLCYAGGETRIISVNPASTTSLASLASHLRSCLSISPPFCLKYQLPNHDLDSLISLLTDEDLLIMLDELQRLFSSSSSSSSAPARIRLFVFPANPEPKGAKSAIQHPKSESWFSDALKGAKIMQKGRINGGGLGFEGEAQGEDLAAESVVLDTSSSFGSTSSSASLTNLVAVKSNLDEGAIGLQESSAKLTPLETVPSEFSSSPANSSALNVAYQDPPVTNLAPMENRLCSNPYESEMNTMIASSYQLDPLKQRKVQYIQMDPNNPNLTPVSSSFYPFYHTQLPQQHPMQLPYQHTQPQPIYLVSVAPAQAYNAPPYTGFVENPVKISGQTPVHHTASYRVPYVVQTEPTRTDTLPSFASQAYATAHSAVPLAEPSLLHVPYSEILQRNPAVGSAYRESIKDGNEVLDEAARAQIYKSQPPPPPCSSLYQTVPKAKEVILSEALDQLHTDTMKHQIRASPLQ